jgi:hypothetical protein
VTAARAQILVAVGLAALTGAELAIKYARVPHALTATALLALALANAAGVVTFSMHLRTESRALKLAFLAPLVLPALYAFAIIVEAATGARGP